MVTYYNKDGSSVTSVDPNKPLAPGQVLVYDPAGNPFAVDQNQAATFQKYINGMCGNTSTCQTGTTPSNLRPVAPGTPLQPGLVWVYDKYGNQYQTTPDMAAGLQKYVDSRERPLSAGYEYIVVSGQKIPARSDMIAALNNPSD